MSIVHPRLPGARVLDLYAGTGALGLEALSRGAAFADFVEESARTARILDANIAALGAGPRAAVHRQDALRFLAVLERRAGARHGSDPATDVPFDVAFADPPYRQGHALAVADAWRRRPFARILGIEHEAGLALPGAADVRRYGDTAVTFYEMTDGRWPVAEGRTAAN